MAITIQLQKDSKEKIRNRISIYLDVLAINCPVSMIMRVSFMDESQLATSVVSLQVDDGIIFWWFSCSINSTLNNTESSFGEQLSGHGNFCHCGQFIRRQSSTDKEIIAIRYCYETGVVSNFKYENFPLNPTDLIRLDAFLSNSYG
jgi:hypothetical protein